MKMKMTHPLTSMTSLSVFLPPPPQKRAISTLTIYICNFMTSSQLRHRTFGLCAHTKFWVCMFNGLVVRVYTNIQTGPISYLLPLRRDIDVSPPDNITIFRLTLTHNPLWVLAKLLPWKNHILYMLHIIY